MPGPGGGSRGGGGGRSGGGSFGGGHSSSHGGGMHHSAPPRGGMHGPSHGGMYRGGWGHGPRYYGRGGGCFGNLIGLLLFPIILIIILVNCFSSFVGTSASNIKQGGVSQYDENTFQDYANSQYAVEFEKSTAYEDNILLVLLVDDENYYDYYYIAWVGDHIVTDVNYMFGNEDTELGRAMSASINANSYKYSLDSNMAQVIETMQNHITALNLNSSFTCAEEHNQVKSHLTNKASLSITEETINSALQSFTDATGIPIVLVVDDIEEVFPAKGATGSIVKLVIGIAVVVLLVYLIFRKKEN